MACLASCTIPGSSEWQQEDSYRWKSMGPGYHFFETNGFEKKASELTGITFQNELSEKQIQKNRNLLNGSGVAAADIDGDGLTDLYFAKLNGPNKLYKNLGGWKFRDITEQSNLGLPDQFSTGVNFSDVDGDSDPDLLVTSLGSTNKIFLNDGDGHFKEKPGALGDSVHGSMSSTFGDIDRDGDLDLYITNYKLRSAKDIYPNQRQFSDIVKQDQDGNYYIPEHLKPHYKYEKRGDVLLWFEKGEDDLLYLNDGNGNFSKVPFSSGTFENRSGDTVTNHQGWGLHARFFDINEDGYADLYVCNDFETPDRIWMNDGDGTFTSIRPEAIRHLSLSSMSIDLADINRDSHYDMFVVEMISRQYQRRSSHLSTMVPLPDTTGAIFNRPLYMGNTLYLNRGDETFSEIADYSGVTASEWSWATSFLDVDLDGYEDAIVATGNYFDTQDLDANSKILRKQRIGAIDPTEVMFEYPSSKSQNVIFQNEGDLRFSDRSTDWGFNTEDISHGLAKADLDNDGDQDIVFNRLYAEAGVYENLASGSRIRISLKDTVTNSTTSGATIEVALGSVIQKKQHNASGSYLSTSSDSYTFAASEDSAMSITVTWPDKSQTVINEVKPNRHYEITKNENSTTAKLTSSSNPAQSDSTLFEDVSQRLSHHHTDLFFDDFELQPLLPYRLSQPGPGVSFFDSNQDGADDLFIGSGKGGELAYFENNGSGDFSRESNPALNYTAGNDQSAIIGWHGKSGSSLLVGNYVYENDSTNTPSFSRFDKAKSEVFKSNKGATSAKNHVATSAMAAADIDADGDLDLFVGKRFSAARYPEAVSSQLYINEEGKLNPDNSHANLFQNIGMVSGATFSDLNGDGYPELLLATEWGRIRIFKNSKGHLEDHTPSTLFQGLHGNWNGIETGDFNNDGRPDIVATNDGLNDFHYSDKNDTKYLFHGDFHPDRDIEIIEAHYETDLEAIAPSRKLRLLGSEIPFIGKQFFSFDQFSKTPLQAMLENKAPEIDTVKVNHARTSVFLNLSDGFKRVSLPAKVQFAPAYAATVADFNSDGNEDLFLSQNFFGGRTQDRRKDAGRGMLLFGNGDGSFQTVGGQKSGIKVYGEQRAAAVSDIDNDNRMDLLVTQNGGRTRLFKNNHPEKGIAIRLNYRDGNPEGIGSSARLLYEDTAGPLREVKAGSGYWTQNTAELLLGYSEYPKAVEVNWPGGEIDTVRLSQKSGTVIIDYEGQVEFR